MTRTEYRKYIASDDWRNRRKQFIEESPMKCERCEIPRWLAQLAYDQDFHVHHKHYRTLGAESPDDLEILCRRCHDVETFGKSELREVKSFECQWCGDRHYDPYGDCQICRAIRGADDHIFPFRLQTPISEDELAWESIIRDLHFVCRHEPLGPDLYALWSELTRKFGKTLR